MKEKRFQRIPQRGWFGGVCAGIAYSLGVPACAIRLICFLLSITFAPASGKITISFGIGAVLYLILWIIVEPAEKEPPDYGEISG